MSDRLTPEREADIRTWVADMGERKDIRYYGPHRDLTDLLAELDALRTEYAELERKAAKLAALEAYGVDSWEGYDEALAGVRATIAEKAESELEEARRKAEELACPVCKGSGLDPDDDGDWDSTVGRHNPNTVAPCPTCMGDWTRQGGAR